MQDISLWDQQLQGALAAEGPFVSLYLNTEVTSEASPHDIELRWRALRKQVEDEGAVQSALAGLDAQTDGSHKRGQGLVAIANAEEVLLTRNLSRGVRDQVEFGALPHIVPLIEWRQGHPSYVLVLADRVGAEIYVVQPYRRRETVSVDGESGPDISRSFAEESPGHDQQRAENLWESNAAEVAEEVANIVRAQGIELIAVAGDVRAVGFLREHLPEKMADSVLEVEGARANSFEGVQEDLEKTLAAFEAGTTEAALDRFRSSLGQDLAVQGMEATLDALRKAQVDTLLIARRGDAEAAWFAVTEPSQAATDRDLLAGLGVESLAQGPVQDVLVRAGYATGAKVRVVPEEQSPSEGVGAILRYS
jgi:peptide subunit release factor 1 (eRF1)